MKQIRIWKLEKKKMTGKSGNSYSRRCKRICSDGIGKESCRNAAAIRKKIIGRIRAF